jgi:hypothetical protein
LGNFSFRHAGILTRQASDDRSHNAHGISFQRIEPARKRPGKLDKTTESSKFLKAWSIPFAEYD